LDNLDSGKPSDNVLRTFQNSGLLEDVYKKKMPRNMGESHVFEYSFKYDKTTGFHTKDSLIADRKLYESFPTE
jgi:hypothetical protein